MHSIKESFSTQIQHVDIHVGERVRARRKALHMSQSDLANALGLTFQQIQKYERGINRISSSTLFMIAHTLQAPVSWFFEGLIPAEDAPSGGARRDIQAFLGTSEAMDLMNAFLAIPTQGLRRHLVDLMHAMGSDIRPEIHATDMIVEPAGGI